MKRNRSNSVELSMLILEQIRSEIGDEKEEGNALRSNLRKEGKECMGGSISNIVRNSIDNLIV